MFGRPVVKAWRDDATMRVTVVNDEGKKYTLSDEQFHQMYRQ